MPATSIGSFTRYANLSNIAVVFVPTIASMASPTRTEINAGKDLTSQLMGLSGWSTTQNFIDAPDYLSGFVGQLPGTYSADASSLDIYLDKAHGTNDPRTLLPRGTNAYVLFIDGGDTAGNLMDVFRVTVASLSKNRDIGGAAAVTVNFAITSPPVEGVTVPA